MKKINWDKLSDKELLLHLKNLPRYRNNSLKSLFWRANFFLHLLYCRLTNTDKPLFIVLVTNNGCNLDCTYCYGDYGKREALDYKDYSTRRMVQILDELKEMGTKLLTMHGGESLLRPDIGEILNYAKLKGFYVSFNTNGYAVPQRLQDIRCVDTVCISLDGREENNDKHRGEGCFNKAVKAIDVLRDNGVPVVVSATLTKEVLNDMEFLAELAVEKKFRIQYSILYNHTDQDQQQSAMTSEETVGITKRILELKKRGYPVYYTDNALQVTMDWPLDFNRRYLLDTDEDFEELTTKNDFIPCYHGSLKYQIDADGRVVVCWAQNDPNAPNINELGIAGALKHVHDNNHCRHCVYLANNEHNGLMELSFKNIMRSIFIQISDAFKISNVKRNNALFQGNNAPKSNKNSANVVEKVSGVDSDGVEKKTVNTL